MKREDLLKLHVGDTTDELTFTKAKAKIEKLSNKYKLLLFVRCPPDLGKPRVCIKLMYKGKFLYIVTPHMLMPMYPKEIHTVATHYPYGRKVYMVLSELATTDLSVKTVLRQVKPKVAYAYFESLFSDLNMKKLNWEYDVLQNSVNIVDANVTINYNLIMPCPQIDTLGNMSCYKTIAEELNRIHNIEEENEPKGLLEIIPSSFTSWNRK